MLGYYTIFFCTSIISHATLCTHNNWHKSTVKTKQYTKPRILCIVVCKSDLRCEVDIWINFRTSQFQNTQSIVELRQWLTYSSHYSNYSRFNDFTSPCSRVASTAAVPLHDLTFLFGLHDSDQTYSRPLIKNNKVTPHKRQQSKQDRAPTNNYLEKSPLSACICNLAR